MANGEENQDNTTSNALMDALILLRIRAERAIQNSVEKYRAQLERADRMLNAQIRRENPMTASARRRLNNLVRDTISQITVKFERDLRGELALMAETSAEKTAAALGKAADREIRDDIDSRTVLDADILGWTAAQWLSDWRDTHIGYYERALNQGVENNADGRDIARDLNGETGQLNKTQDGLVTELSTILIGGFNQGQERIYQRENRSVAYYVHSSVLDTRTSLRKSITYIKFADGSERLMQDIRPGDMVLTGSGQARPVLTTSSYETNDLVRVTLSNGQTIECTPDHLIMTSDGWVKAEDLKPGTVLK